MYMSWESMKLLRDLIDLWLPDLKYGNDSCAYRYSRVRRYWEIVTRNIREAYRNGEIIIRHLVLPNHLECCTRRVLEWIAENTPNALVNIMGQYRPEHLVLHHPEKWPEISRPVSEGEMREAYRIAEELGIHFKPISFM
jgi:putative pyruvate formate lyase activating enzyme